MGRSTVLRNLAVGLADHLDGGRITYWDLEQTHTSWRQRIEKMGCSVPAALTYRNDDTRGLSLGIVETLNLGAPPGVVAAVIDHFELFTDDPAEGLKHLKIWLVRTGKFGLVSMELPHDVWAKFKAEGEINPDTLPGHLLFYPTALFACGKTPQRALDHGDADTLRVIVCKTPTGLRDPHHHHAFIWNHKTGRIS